MKKDLSNYKKKYDTWRHHAWAGSVLIGVLLAVRVFFEISEFEINDWYIISVGLILVFYTLVAVFLTYKYRSGLTADQKNIVEVHVSSDDVERERLKVEKKKAKAEAKKAKKSGKK